MQGKALGLSSELKVRTVTSEKSLRKWLEANEVIVLDIKYAVTENEDIYLIIYR